VGLDENAGWTLVSTGGVTGMAVSQAQADTVFVNFSGALKEHVGTDPNAGWSLVWGSGVTDIQAGVDVQGKPAAFANFSGALWEHVGTNPSTGWSLVCGSGVTGLSASQTEADTVLTNLSGALWEHMGKSPNAGWFLIWDGKTPLPAAPIINPCPVNADYDTSGQTSADSSGDLCNNAIDTSVQTSGDSGTVDCTNIVDTSTVQANCDTGTDYSASDGADCTDTYSDDAYTNYCSDDDYSY
jgi:hypothetical protein